MDVRDTGDPGAFGENRVAVNGLKREDAMIHSVFPLAAIGYSLIYLLFGGGLGGAVVIFIIAKLLGR
jgi:hypothetical protein